MSNPYQSPQAPLARDTSGDETYMPSLFSVSGRIGRVRYLAYSMGITLLAYLAMFVVGGGVGASVSAAGGGEAGLMAGFGAIILVSLAIIPFSVIIMRRRLHDLEKSGWFCLLMFVPLVNLFFGLYMLFAAGTAGGNRYGPAPGPNTTGVLILAWTFPAIFVIGILAAILIPLLAGGGAN